MALPPAGDIAIVVAGALVAGFVNGLSGTGYALVALGFWLQAMSPVTAAPLVAICSVAAMSSRCRGSGAACAGRACGRSSPPA